MDTFYILVSGRRVQPVTIAVDEGEFCIVEFGHARIRLRKSRLYRTESAALAAARPSEPMPAPGIPAGLKARREKFLYEQGY